VTLTSYHLVGVYRLTHGGLAVYAPESLAFWAVSNADLPSLEQLVTGAAGARLVQSTPLLLVASAAFLLVTGFEVAAPAAFASRRFRGWFLAVILPFHALSLPLLGVFFYQNAILLVLFAYFDRGVGAPVGDGAWKSASGRRCAPAASRLSGASQAESAAATAGHSQSRIENQAVSRLRPFTTRSCRNTPSKRNPRRRAARFEASLASSHFHS
jgi:hypothetical protein